MVRKERNNTHSARYNFPGKTTTKTTQLKESVLLGRAIDRANKHLPYSML
jgi:hypothetical protein